MAMPRLQALIIIIMQKPTYDAARKALKKAKKAVKTGLFKWSADYEAAADHYHEAAEGFEASQRLKEAMEA